MKKIIDTAVERRRLLLQSAAAAGTLLSAPAFGADDTVPTTAIVDLMREHGVLRRALMVYRHCAQQLHQDRPQGLAKALNQTAQLFRRFGEDYHERAVEEKYIFPMLQNAKPPISRYPALLTEQHRQGRKVTDYVKNVTRNGSIGSGDVKPLAATLDAFTLMYSHHANREDTEVFVAWKKSMPKEKYEELGHTFETVEQREVGEDGFEDAIKTISGIEQQLGIAALEKFTVQKIPV
jgi:hemerythrin-like domain-containing protein